MNAATLNSKIEILKAYHGEEDFETLQELKNIVIELINSGFKFYVRMDSYIIIDILDYYVIDFDVDTNELKITNY